MTSIANVNSVTINSAGGSGYGPFCSNRNIVSVDLGGVPWTNNRMYNTFYGCSNLTTVTNINSNITNMSLTFYGCSNLVTAPTIPNSVTEMYQTFYSCPKLTTVSIIPSSVTNMAGAFGMDRNLTTVPTIPANVTNMSLTFLWCNNLTGNIFIESNKITMASSCFASTNLLKNVYIPFTYSNGVNTKTYNSFITAGYKTDGSKEGVYLKDINGQNSSMYYSWKLYRLGPESSPAPFSGSHYCYSTKEEPSVGDLVYTGTSDTAEITGYSTGDLQFTQYAEVAHYARYSDYDTTDLTNAVFYEDVGPVSPVK